jgi:hypothetical protein
MIHDKRSIIIALCIAGAMFLAGWGFIICGLVMATGGAWS